MLLQHRKRIIPGAAIVLLLGVGGLFRTSFTAHPLLTGETMGTGWRIRISGQVKRKDLKRLSREVERELYAFDRQMSTWNPESEISRFNRSRSLAAFPCSAALAAVVQRALELGESTGGAFDPTLLPLLNLWGFGSGGGERKIPPKQQVTALLKKTGQEQVSVEPPSCIRKKKPEVSLVLGAIAKGYGVDALTAILKKAGYKNWFVGIGGEVAVQGLNPDGIPWKIGVQFPSAGLLDCSLQGILHMTNGAAATSGDYHNFFIEEDSAYPHIFDPRSGRPVRSETASVTVAAPNCMDADGIATALYVMGAEEGIAWVEKEKGIEALFLVRSHSGEIIEIFSSGFKETAGYINVPQI